MNPINKCQCGHFKSDHDGICWGCDCKAFVAPDSLEKVSMSDLDTPEGHAAIDRALEGAAKDQDALRENAKEEAPFCNVHGINHGILFGDICRVLQPVPADSSGLRTKLVKLVNIQWASQDDLIDELSKIITQKETEARLDEIGAVKASHGQYETITFIDGTPSGISVKRRYAELKTQQEKK